MIKFLGVGNSFSSLSLNTSAYFIENKVFYLFDIGENVFFQINKSKPYRCCNEVVIFLTHFHSDYVGSLGTFVFSLRNFGLKPNNIKIFNPKPNILSTIISAFGLKNDCVVLKNINLLIKSFNTLNKDIMIIIPMIIYLSMKKS